MHKPKLTYKADADCGLLEIFVNGELFTNWAYDDHPEHSFEEFQKAYMAGYEVRAEKEIQAAAVGEFVGSIIGALESGFIDKNNPTLAEIHRVAQVYIKDSYGIDYPSIVEQWGQEVADLCGLGKSND